MAFLRLFVGWCALALVALRHRRPLPRGRALAIVVGYGVLRFAGYAVVLNWAEQHLDAGTAALLVNVAPILVAVVAGVLFHDGFPRRVVIGMLSLSRGSSSSPSATTAVARRRLSAYSSAWAPAVLYAAGVLFLGLGPTATAFTAWAYVRARTDAGRMAATTLCVPALVVLMSWATEPDHRIPATRGGRAVRHLVVGTRKRVVVCLVSVRN
jgi:drug/metabolite transporter (DMT)-like permease